MVTTLEYTLSSDRIYGNASGDSLLKSEWCLPQSPSNSVRNKEDYAVAAVLVG